MADEDSHLQPYLDVVDRLTALAASADDTQLQAMVPACPDWTVTQTLSHLAGLAEDWVAGNLDDYASDAWAQAQADRYADRSIGELLEAWRVAADRFHTITTSPLGATPARWAFGDAACHEADLRPILAPGTHLPDDAAALGAQAAVSRWRQQIGEAGLAPLDVVATDLRTWAVGDPEARAAANEPIPTVTTTALELFRALFGRRSRAQMAAWDWTTDPTPYLDIDLPYPFQRTTVDLVD